MEALVRNLATLTRVGIVGGAFSQGTKDVIAKMSDEEVVRKSRLHPIKALSALLTYSAGHGMRGSNTWTPDKKIVDALDDLFYATFQNIIPTGKRRLLALDVSGSMGYGTVAGVLGLTPCMAATAMAMITMRTESDCEIRGFAGTFKELNITATDTLSAAMKKAHDRNFGSTDCSLPMEWARTNKIALDSFEIYTDNETYAETIQPVEALRNFRREMNVPDAKLIVVGMVSTNFTIADPTDKFMMDFVGFDSSAPTLMADFIRGEW
jgi:60 kDa SS-A/Ro ribonucleoprotein